MMTDVIEAMVRLAQHNLTMETAAEDDKTLAISCAALFKTWVPGTYEAGDIRRDPATGYPRECILAHDSAVNTNWTITTPTLWKPYHSRKKEYALPWESPTGAHDMYKAGEYMVWTDGTYLCLEDTSYSPEDYPAAWEKI